MKRLNLKLVLSLTIILFFALTKWRCAKVVDAPNSLLQGFPLAYTCTGWGSSMSWQFFMLEFAIDFAVYFLFFSIMFYLIDRFILRIKLYKTMLIMLYIIAGLILCFQALIYSRDTAFYLHRSFNINVIESRYVFFWQYYSGCY
jgi:hypothetical protein